MTLVSDIYFHGTPAAAIREILDAGVIRPNRDGKIFFSRFDWEPCLMHGADRVRKASFVVKVKLKAPAGAQKIFTETPGVRGTVVLRSSAPVPVTLLELYVRRMDPEREAPAQLHVLRGEEAIKSYLTTLP